MIEIFHISDLHFGKQTKKARLLLRKIKEKYGFEQGNSVESAKRNFIPLIVTELQKLKRNVPTSRPARSGHAMGREMVTEA